MTSESATGTSHLDYARLLGQIDLFVDLERVTLAKLAAHLEPVSAKQGSVVFHQDDPGDALYLIAGGSVGVYTADADRLADICVKVLGPGEPFGEMALLANRPRTATIKAEADSEVLRLDRAVFLDLVRQELSVALAVAATLSHRLAGMLDDSGDKQMRPASVEAESEHHLSRALRRHGWAAVQPRPSPPGGACLRDLHRDCRRAQRACLASDGSALGMVSAAGKDKK